MKKSYIITMRHDEKTLTALSHMQYDLFCTRNYIVRSILAMAAILVGGWYFKQIWGILLLAYGTYLLTSTYASANHTARKLIAAIQANGGSFPPRAISLRRGRSASSTTPASRTRRHSIRSATARCRSWARTGRISISSPATEADT